MGHLSETMERIRAERIARKSFPKNSNKENESVEEGNNSGGNLEKIKDINRNVPEDISETDRLLIELKKNEPTSDNQFFRLAILAYEMGDLNRSIVYAERFKNDEKVRIAHLANGKLAMADVLTQLHLLCQSVGWDFHELRKLGIQHLKERQEDFKEQGWSEIK